jgi:integrase
VKIHSTKRKRVGALEAHAAPDGTISYRGRLLLADGSRSPRFALTAGLTEAEARHEVAKFQAQEDATGQVLAAMRDRAREKAAKALAPHDLETADAWFARYLPTKECGAGHRRTTRQWWAMWISPVLGAKPVASLTRDDLEDVRDALDVAIAEGRIRSASARNIWSILTSAMKAASAAKDRSLRVHAAPLHFGILPPKRTASRQRPWLFPREWSALASCEAIPLVERQVFAIALYTGLRPGELWALTWGDVDLESRTLSVSKATDDESDNAKAPKTAEGQRIVPIHPNLLPLLAAMKGAPSALVVPRVVQNMGKRFRARLAEAGITRPRLTASTPTEEPADFRSLRDSYATWLAILGTSTDVVKRRMGHRDLATTERYIKAAEAFDADGVGEPFPPLPAGLLLPSAGGPFQDPFQGAPEGAGFPRNLGSDCRTRTYDPAVNSRLLYRLS